MTMPLRRRHWRDRESSNDQKATGRSNHHNCYIYRATAVVACFILVLGAFEALVVSQTKHSSVLHMKERKGFAASNKHRSGPDSWLRAKQLAAPGYETTSTTSTTDTTTPELPVAPATDYTAKLKAATSTPINVIVMTALHWEFNPHATENCALHGIPLDCRLTQDQTGADVADALYYNVPGFQGKLRPKAFPNQLRLAGSLESAANYLMLDNPDYMCRFDAEVSYRHCSQAPQYYCLGEFRELFATEPVPFDQKEHALVYINSNCDTPSNRADIMRELMALNGSVPVHSLGECDNNMPWPVGISAKREVQRWYKFCVTMENSVSPDYVTEKLWDGLISGCIPVYMGAARAVEMVPDRQGMIVYDPAGHGDASTPQELANLLQTIGNNKQMYESMLGWKYRKPEDQPNSFFRYLWSVHGISGECSICQFLARHRLDPKPRYTTCLFNQQWALGNGRRVVNATSQDGPCPPV